MSERANIRDVAALAGVAVKTVSRVLNSHPYVSAETRERVEKAMRELDFHPSVAARIRRLAEEKDIPVHAFVEDVAASGGYWLACAADDIWVDASSITGYIGVIFASFGFPELMARQGIERRVVTAGKSKSLADPFLPQKPEDVDRLKAIQQPIHDAFIQHVKDRRGARLSAAEDLFNADVFVGARAVQVGLADGIAHPVPKLKALYGDKMRLVPLGIRRSLSCSRLLLSLDDGF